MQDDDDTATDTSSDKAVVLHPCFLRHNVKVQTTCVCLSLYSIMTSSTRAPGRKVRMGEPVHILYGGTCEYGHTSIADGYFHNFYKYSFVTASLNPSKSLVSPKSGITFL